MKLRAGLLVAGLAFTVLAAAVVNHAASAQPPHPPQLTKIKPAKDMGKDVVDTALADSQLSTWARAVKQSGMDSTLHLTPGNFTLFVPTNAAFAKLPPATLKKLFDNSSDSQEALTMLVMRHAIVGNVLRAADLKPGNLKPTMGPPITVVAVKARAKNGRGVTVSGAHLVRSDIAATNGVIHAVDTVFPK